MSESNNVSHWINQIKHGDSAAANRIWQHYFDRLVKSVRGRLQGQNRAVSDEEDIVLSRGRLDIVRKVYLQVGPIIGFPWWLMWIPVAVAIGFDEVLHPNSLVPSLAVGLVGMAVSYWLYMGVQRANSPSAEEWRKRFGGKSIANAQLFLDEIEQAQIG